jgi:DNA-binding response OmpR family regulator
MRVLIADDEADSVLLCRLAFELGIEGCEVLATTSGAAALNLALTEQLDAIVLDVRFPDVNGLEVLFQLRRRGIDTPVVLLTGLARIDDEVNGMEAGADGYLRKPFSPLGLCEAVRTVVAATPEQRERARASALHQLNALKERLDDHARERRQQQGIDRLTPTERRVANVLVSGGAMQEACDTLGFAPGTYWSHMRAIRRKLDVPRGLPLGVFLRAVAV